MQVGHVAPFLTLLRVPSYCMSLQAKHCIFHTPSQLEFWIWIRILHSDVIEWDLEDENETEAVSCCFDLFYRQGSYDDVVFFVFLFFQQNAPVQSPALRVSEGNCVEGSAECCVLAFKHQLRECGEGAAGTRFLNSIFWKQFPDQGTGSCFHDGSVLWRCSRSFLEAFPRA